MNSSSIGRLLSLIAAIAAGRLIIRPFSAVSLADAERRNQGGPRCCAHQAPAMNDRAGVRSPVNGAQCCDLIPVYRDFRISPVVYGRDATTGMLRPTPCDGIQETRPTTAPSLPAEAA